MGQGHDHSQFSLVAHIPFGREITDIVRGFAAARDLACDAYYHNLPVWIVQDRHLTERTRRLQITVYLVSTKPYVSLVPSVHAFSGGDKLLVPRMVDAERFEIGKVLNESNTIDRGKLCKRLDRAWNKTATLRYAREQLMEVQLTGVAPAAV